MNHFSEISKERLATCHRDLSVLFAHVIIDYDCSIICGERNESDQNKAFDAGFSKLQFPKSKHNSHPSFAVDVLPYEDGHTDGGKLQTAYFAGYVKGIADQLYRIGTISHRIRCGVDWSGDNDVDDNSFWDGGHFELIKNERDI
jgi:peptidoglycan L-alanyl-D-glutamate endopeptidase CwlK